MEAEHQGATKEGAEEATKNQGRMEARRRTPREEVGWRWSLRGALGEREGW
jgi:hypothetical protein